MTMTKSNGLDQVVNLSNVVDIVAGVAPEYIYGADTDGLVPDNQLTKTDQYIVKMHMVDNREVTLYMGQQTGDGALWVNTLVGANLAVADIEAAR